MSGIHQVIEGLDSIKTLKKSFDKIKFKEEWKDLETTSKEDLKIPTKYLQIDTGTYGKKNTGIYDGAVVAEVQEYLKRRRERSLSDIELVLKKLLHEPFRVIEVSNFRILLKSQRNKRRLIEIRYSKKLKKSIDVTSSDVTYLDALDSNKPLSSNEVRSIAASYRNSDESQIPDAELKVKNLLSNNITPIKEEPVNVKAIEKESNCSAEFAHEAADVSKSLFSASSSIEPKITSDLVSTVKKFHGKMYGLDFRLKQPTSLGRKLATDAIEFGGDLEKAAMNIKDAIRYTVVYPLESFTELYRVTKKELESHGYIEVRCKNFYLRYARGNSQQKSIQCVYRCPEGVYFELQFHTVESQGVKELNHPMYEKFRDASVSGNEKEVLNQRMINLSENVQDPEFVLDIEEHG